MTGTRVIVISLEAIDGEVHVQFDNDMAYTFSPQDALEFSSAMARKAFEIQAERLGAD